MPESTPPARERFDTLLSDPRHYRADFRAIRAALRQGRLDSLSDEEGDALMRRVHSVGGTLNPGQRTDSTTFRAFMAYVRLMIDLERQNQRAYWQARGYMLPGRPRAR